MQLHNSKKRIGRYWEIKRYEPRQCTYHSEFPNSFLNKGNLTKGAPEVSTASLAT